MPTNSFRVLVVALALTGVITAGTTFGVADTNQTKIDLLTKDELFNQVVEGERTKYTASPYYVADNGTWFHAHPNGSIGAIAPYGNVVPNVDREMENGTTMNETIQLETEQRPAYVWKVTRKDCGTTVYNASNGELIAEFPAPACDVPSKPTATPTVMSTPTSISTVAPTATEKTEPGFGIRAVVIAVLAIALLAARQDSHR